MPRETYTYSTDIDKHEGRRISGRAFYWDSPQQTQYGYESFARGCATKSVTERKKFPIGLLHPWNEGARTSPIPVGAVSFSEESDGLYWEGVLSNTTAGDEALELIRDGAMTDVSMGCFIMNTKQEGNLQVRTEIALRELSLCPTGYGALEGAQVLANFQMTDNGLSQLALSKSKLRLLTIRAGL